MRSLFVSFCLLLTASIAFGQSDRGAVTGAISDATGAVIPRASVVATNTETAAKYETISTDTGNYTLSQLPPVCVSCPSSYPDSKDMSARELRCLWLRHCESTWLSKLEPRPTKSLSTPTLHY